MITIPEGYSLEQTAQELHEQNIIISPNLFLLYARINPFVVKAGTYQFNQGNYSLTEVTHRLAQADYGDIYLRLTIPEGSSRSEIAEILKASELDINPDEFLQQSAGLEGYLFPETYFFLPDDTVDVVIDTMTNTFDKTIDELQEGINQSGRSLEDLVIMASIIEKEATSDPAEQKIVSGILWKRIDENMLLQVDAPFLFTEGKTSAQLSLTDLRQDGPYNTYTRLGLTPTAIGNPGASALEAAIYPTDSLYYFYLHDRNGIIRYGVTHDDHVRNKQRYLR
jgi:UPF0755 protein